MQLNIEVTLENDEKIISNDQSYLNLDCYEDNFSVLNGERKLSDVKSISIVVIKDA